MLLSLFFFHFVHICYFFFFSSRRRHTRCLSDWSSDVCSSDLTVITADSGEDALEILAKNEPIDLLISDVVMPGMDGPTMVREARLSRPELKILFMSGYAEEQLRKSIDIENVNFLPKPFSVVELAEAARRTT